MRGRWRQILVLVAGVSLVSLGCRRQEKDIFVGTRGTQTAYIRFVNLLAYEIRAEIPDKNFGILPSRKATQFEPVRTGSIAATAYEGPMSRIDGHVDMESNVAYTMVLYPSSSSSKCLAVPNEPQLSPKRRSTIRVVSLVNGGQLVWASIANSRAKAALANSLGSFEGSISKQVAPGTYRLTVRAGEKKLSVQNFTVGGGQVFTLFVWRDRNGKLQIAAIENKTRWFSR